MNNNKRTLPPLLRTGSKGAERHLLLYVLMVAFFIGLFITSLISLAAGSNTRGSLLFIAVIQDVLAFILPAAVTGWLFTRRPIAWLNVNKAPAPLVCLGVIAVFVVSVGFLNYVVALNESMTLPQWLSGIEKSMRIMENQAAATTEILLGGTSAGDLISSILIVGLIGPFAEEVFFRGALQRSIYGPHPWKAVWWTALIFSLLHFQMYGFVPRFLLGLWFGYLYLWTGNLWPCVLAHALNNSVTVVSKWLVMRGCVDSEVFNLGADGNPAIIAISILLSITAIFIIRKIVPLRNSKYINPV